MSAVPDKIDAEGIRRALQGAIFGHEVIVLAETTSTNDEIVRLIDHASEGVVVFAEKQTAGRGQRGNYWESVAGKGLWFSTLLIPEIDVRESAAVTAWAARAIVLALHEAFGIEAKVKFPNDIYVDSRKLGGVLVELRARPGSAHIAILGIGINVNHTLADFSESLRRRATSLALELGRSLSRNEVSIAMLRVMETSYPFRKSTD